MTDRPDNVMKDDIVALMRDIASLKLASGDIGKVLSVSGNGYEVMFPRIEGEHHLVVQRLVADDLEKAAGFTALAGPAAIGQAEALHKLQHSMYRRTYQLVKLLLGLDEEAYIDYDAESGGMTVTTHVKAPDVEQVLAERSFWTEEQAANDMRRAYRAEDLPEKWMRALENTGMSSRHEHLNKLLEQDNDDDRSST